MSSQENGILPLLRIVPSPQSQDYVQEKKQYQLHNLLTEQRHPKTWTLSAFIKKDVRRGLEQIFAVDEDIVDTFQKLAENPVLLEQAAYAVASALRNHKKIFIYGCGATGRLAKQIESALWRPFWRTVKKSMIWHRLKHGVPEDIEDHLIGEMTGGDIALISSLEGFEDLEIVGRLQLQNHAVERGDTVFCITEGGETSSVIGAVLAAREQYGEHFREAAGNLYFIYNNPDDVLRPFERSRRVLDEAGISKINLSTGPQAIAGSTRMQATTSETLVMGAILEAGIREYLHDLLSIEELTALGFDRATQIKDRLLGLSRLREIIISHLSSIAAFTSAEAQTYENGNRATYYAQKALVTVFTDCTERSPTFHLDPIDTVREPQRKCWFQVWTKGEDASKSWQNFLGRRFRGLEESYYSRHFQAEITDGYLKQAALYSLGQAGNDQELSYDFSFPPSRQTTVPQVGDLCVLVCLDEEVQELSDPNSHIRAFVDLSKTVQADLALVLLCADSKENIEQIVAGLPLDREKDIVIHLDLDSRKDPLNLNGQVLLKMILNGHSTGVMSCLGRVVGNTMTSVYPTNLKLIGRATFLIRSHVNDTLSMTAWRQKYGKIAPLSYADANAVLFAAMDFVAKQSCQISEVELSIVRILEAIRRREFVSWEETLELKSKFGLEDYLAGIGRLSGD